MPATAIIDQSSARRGSGTRRTRMMGSKTAIAIASRIAAKLTGGRSRNPILMNSQTLLQIKQVSHQSAIVTGCGLFETPATHALTQSPRRTRRTFGYVLCELCGLRAKSYVAGAEVIAPVR